jgi:hypothetical protein
MRCLVGKEAALVLRRSCFELAGTMWTSLCIVSTPAGGSGTKSSSSAVIAHMVSTGSYRGEVLAMVVRGWLLLADTARLFLQHAPVSRLYLMIDELWQIHKFPSAPDPSASQAALGCDVIIAACLPQAAVCACVPSPLTIVSVLFTE